MNTKKKPTAIRRMVDAYGYVTYNTKRTYVGKELAGHTIGYPFNPDVKDIQKEIREAIEEEKAIFLGYHDLFESIRKKRFRGKHLILKHKVSFDKNKSMHVYDGILLRIKNTYYLLCTCDIIVLVEETQQSNRASQARNASRQKGAK